MEDEFFDLDIPGLDPKEMEKARKAAQKDMKDENTYKTSHYRKSAPKAYEDSRES